MQVARELRLQKKAGLNEVTHCACIQFPYRWSIKPLASGGQLISYFLAPGTLHSLQPVAVCIKFVKRS